jgi:uncharacterized membrane protein
MSTRHWTAVALAGLLIGSFFTVPAQASKPAENAIASTDIYIRNYHAHAIDVASAVYDNSCRGWLVEGWWTIDSGEQQHVATAQGGIFLFYAESVVDDTKWVGPALSVNVPDTKFSSCDSSLRKSGPSRSPIRMRQQNYNTFQSTYVAVLR